ncbi:MAG: IGHMBP2 family helicase, partial [Candidatus Omnitrophica bacterium]|nr:IGHMBP2 family helicase [Candidatus Omnitrophota bacterium]
MSLSEKIHAHFDTFRRLLELERDEEIRMVQEEMSGMSATQRESRGHALARMRFVSEDTGLGGMRVLRFSKADPNQSLPQTTIRTGDWVMI